jgi:hypothetical protein
VPLLFVFDPHSIDENVATFFTADNVGRRRFSRL